MDSSKPCAIGMSLMLSETANDKVIQKVIQLKSGKLQHCKEKKVSSYNNIYIELTTVSETGLLLRNRRIVSPKSFQ